MVRVVEARFLWRSGVRLRHQASMHRQEHGPVAFLQVVSTTADESPTALGAPAQGEHPDMSLCPFGLMQAGPFKEPLPWKELGLDDYPEAPRPSRIASHDVRPCRSSQTQST